MIVLDYLYEVGNWTSGVDKALVDTVSSVNVFTPMFLIFVFGVVFLTGSIAQKKRDGFADMPMWVTIASVSIMMISLSMTMVEGLIQLETLSIVAIITIFSGFWLFMDKRSSEV
jgi:hypothetical protein